MRMLRIAAFALALAPIGAAAQTMERPPPPLAVGDTAPQFAVSTTAGPFNLATTKTPVVIGIFATWCPHCKNEVATVNEIARKYAGRVRVVSVNGSQYGPDRTATATEDDLTAYARTNGATYALGYDPLFVIGRKYARGFPTHVVVGTDKRVRAYLEGESTVEQLSTAIDAAL